MIDIADSFGRPVIVMDESHHVERSALSFAAWARDASLPAEAPAAFCYPSLQIVDRSY